MFTIGLTGGIGSGKSEVSRYFESSCRFAVVDADVIARKVVRPGNSGLSLIKDAFGENVIKPDGELDRVALADVVFKDSDALDRLNKILHPLIRREIEIELEMAEREDPNQIVVVVVPLLAESEPNTYHFDRIVVIDADQDTALERLKFSRGMDAQEALNRIRNQASREKRLSLADYVIENSGSLSELHSAIDACCCWIIDCVEASGV